MICGPKESVDNTLPEGFILSARRDVVNFLADAARDVLAYDKQRIENASRVEKRHLSAPSLAVQSLRPARVALKPPLPRSSPGEFLAATLRRDLIGAPIDHFCLM